MHVCIFFVIYIFFAPAISTNIHRYMNNSYDIKILMKVIKTETFNVGTINSPIWIILFSIFFMLSDSDPYLLSYI